MNAAERSLILSTPHPNCPACKRRSIHTETDWILYHPFRTHGYVSESGWSHPALKPKAVALIPRATATVNPPPTGPANNKEKELINRAR
jgi:hypothetical protein